MQYLESWDARAIQVGLIRKLCGTESTQKHKPFPQSKNKPEQWFPNQNYLGQRFSRRGPGPVLDQQHQNHLSEMQILRPTPDLPESEILGLGLRNLCFNKLFG